MQNLEIRLEKGRILDYGTSLIAEVTREPANWLIPYGFRYESPQQEGFFKHSQPGFQHLLAEQEISNIGELQFIFLDIGQSDTCFLLDVFCRPVIGIDVQNLRCVLVQSLKTS